MISKNLLQNATTLQSDRVFVVIAGSGLQRFEEYLGHFDFSAIPLRIGFAKK